MEILITGDKGFIGSNLINYLKDYHIYGIDYPNNVLKSTLPPVDCVIHLAASTGVRSSHKNPKAYFDNNIKTTKRIFDHYKDTKILFASTSSVSELQSPYSMSKYACELMAPDNVVIMRFFTVWGEQNYRTNMLYGMAMNDQLNYITDHKRDFTHVYDLQNSSRTSFYRKFLLKVSNWSSTETLLKNGQKKENYLIFVEMKLFKAYCQLYGRPYL